MTRAERGALDELENEQRQVRRGATLVAEGERARELYIVQKGWLLSSVLLGNGGRQIMRIGLPGDILGLPHIAFQEAPETISALTDAVLCPFDRDRLSGLFTAHPRLAALLFAITVAERTSLADRLASVGRTPARARVAALLCDIFARHRMTQGPETDTVLVPLTQEEIGDATGLTAVHVNRMMRGLADEGIIERNGTTIRLVDNARLADEANFTNRLEIGTGWLPPSAT